MGIDVNECSNGTASSQCIIFVKVSDIRRVLKKDDASKSKGEFYFCHYFFQPLKPNYFNNQCFSSSFLLTTWSTYSGTKWPWSTRQATSMHFRHVSRVRTTEANFAECVYFFFSVIFYLLSLCLTAAFFWLVFYVDNSFLCHFWH